MSWNQPAEFCEGDSGVPMRTQSIQIWNDIELEKQRKAEALPELATVSAIDYLADIAGMAMKIARNEKNEPLARAKALDVARKAAMDQTRFGSEDHGSI